MMINNGPHDKAQIHVPAATRSQERAICSRRLPCSTLWSKAELNKQWGKPVVTVSSESRLERLDMKFAAEHAKKATKATTSPSFLV
ncbi:hypothetical protein [Pseudomonas syringae]|uniref:hypothetical protein n=1 Tax=Pseudomonas syringae TaxID=317 RepID=UPI000C0828C1|nr:hypothetical protein [Pseudomonas syringae]